MSKNRKYTPRPVYIHKGKFVSPKNPPDGTKVYFKGQIVGEVKDGIVPQRTKRERAKPKTTEEWLKRREKSEQNERYRQAQQGKREFTISGREPSSMSETTAEYVGADSAYSKLRQAKELAYKETLDKEGNKTFVRTVDEFNLNLYKANNYYTEEKQAEIVDIFNEANETMAAWEEEYGITVGRGFHLYKSDTPESIEKKIDKALEVTEEGYLEKLGMSYKLDFLSNFSMHVTGEDYDKFSAEVLKLDNKDFLRFLKDTKTDFLAYALDSIIDRHGYEQILSEIKYITKRLSEFSKGA